MCPDVQEELIRELMRRLCESPAGLVEAEPHEDPVALICAIDEASARAQLPISRAWVGGSAELLVWLHADDARLQRNPHLVIVGVRA